jgi:hypothetical protein
VYMPLPTLIAVLQTKVREAITEGRTLLYRSNTIVGRLVVECSVLQHYTVRVKVASDVNVVAVLGRDERIDDVLESGGVRVVCRRCLTRLGVLWNSALDSTCSTMCREHTNPNVPKPPHCSVGSPAQA